MTAPASRKPSPAPAAAEGPDLLSVLVERRVLTAETRAKARRARKVTGSTAEQAIVQLGITSEVKIAQAVAAHAGLPYVKINPLDLDLDVVTRGSAGRSAA